MKRRELIILLGGTAVAWPLSVKAQQIRLVAVLMNGNSNDAAPQVNVNAFAQALRDLGWVEERTLRLEIRWSGGNVERARSFASELIALSPAAIMCASTANLLALKNSTNIIPIVFLQVSDPVAQGFVPSLTKPGGNVTGFTGFEFSIGGKWLELLKQIAPGLARVAVMSNPDTSPQSKFFMRAIESAAPGFDMRVESAPVRSMADIERAMEEIARSPGGGIIIPTDSYMRTRCDQIAALTLKYRVPAIAAFSEFIDHGGLMFYGNSSNENNIDQFRQAASYVDRILKGTKPGDLPVQAPSKFTLLINRKTATAFGLEIPPKLLYTADKVIE
jgi:putative ABC transport system substrate-binding protein